MSKSLAVFDLNDVGIELAIDGEVVTTSPGYAVLDGNRLLLGEEAMANSRLLPRWTNNRFWNALGTEGMPAATGEIRHHADLALAHLESLWSPIRSDAEQAIFITPGHYSREQLALLLGVAKECGITVGGLIDSSLATVSDLSTTPVTLHLDIYLHRITLTVLKADQQLSATETITVTDSGLATLWDRWANIIANQFIQSSRFDPLHQAISEQKLYDKIPGWIANLDAARSHLFELPLGDSDHATSISNEQLLNACTTVYPQIVQLIRSHLPGDKRATLYLSNRMRGFPGLQDSLNLLDGVDIAYTVEGSAISTVMRHRNRILGESDRVSQTRTLPLSPEQQVYAAPTPVLAGPTHLLSNNHAIAVGASFNLSAEVKEGLREDNSPVAVIYPHGSEMMLEPRSSGLTLNGNQVANTTSLSIGDELGVGNIIITLIRVSG